MFASNCLTKNRSRARFQVSRLLFVARFMLLISYSIHPALDRFRG
jgi:hypothetical protein